MTIKKLIVIIVLYAGLASCKKVLEVDPQYQLDGNTRFKTLDDYEFALVGVYQAFRDTDYYGASEEHSNAFVTLPDILTDNLNETTESLGNESVFSRWLYAEDEKQVEQTWVASYQIIAQANTVLTDIDKFAAQDPGRVNRIKGQAMAIRALVHFDLLRYWANDYDRNSTSPGVPYINKFDYEVKPARGTVKQTYDNIETDLKAARTLLQNTDQDINGDGSNPRAYVDEFVTDAMLARMYLYSNQMDSAIKYSTMVIDEFPLADFDVFPGIWTDAASDEVIWSVTFESGQGAPGLNVYFPQVNASSYRPNPTLVASYNQSADIRFFSYFGVISNRRVSIKYLAKEAQFASPDGVVNFKVFRTGEMYLIRAEAYSRKANDVNALLDLNTLRAARIAGYIDANLSGVALRNAIDMERRKELFCEGHRFFDLKRTTRVVARPNCTGTCNLAAGSRSWTWPIPQTEIDANPNILPQNPGY